MYVSINKNLNNKISTLFILWPTRQATAMWFALKIRMLSTYLSEIYPMCRGGTINYVEKSAQNQSET